MKSASISARWILRLAADWRLRAAPDHAAQHVNPEGGTHFQAGAARKAWAVHWGTFILTDEPIQQPMANWPWRCASRMSARRFPCCRRSAKPSGCHDAQPMASDCPLAQLSPFCCNANIARHGWGHTIDTVNFFENEGFFVFTAIWGKHDNSAVDQ
jgi:hypothetical protein